MTDHTIEARFEVKLRMGVEERSAAIEARAIELLCIAIAGGPCSPSQHIKHEAIARAIYRGVYALPAVMAQVRKEFEEK